MLPGRADRRGGTHRGGLRRPFPMIRRAQGARRLRLPGAARRHRPVRSDQPPGHLALDRQLLPGRRRDLPPDGLPGRGRAARGDEPGAVRLARATGSATRRGHHPHRRAPRATSRRSTTRAASWPRTPPTSSSTSSASSATTSSTTRCTGRALGHVFDVDARRPSRACGCAAFVSATGLGRHPRRRRLPQGALRRQDRRRRGARVPDDAGERVRRAQHPGHRRQAHPADPQRDEHRRRGRRSPTGPPTSSTCCSTPTTGAATWPTAAASPQPRRRRRSAHFGLSSASATSWPPIKTAKVPATSGPTT